MSYTQDHKWQDINLNVWSGRQNSTCSMIIYSEIRLSHRKGDSDSDLARFTNAKDLTWSWSHNLGKILSAPFVNTAIMICNRRSEVRVFELQFARLKYAR